MERGLEELLCVRDALLFEKEVSLKDISTEELADSVYPILRDIEDLEQFLLDLADSVRHKRTVLEKAVAKLRKKERPRSASPPRSSELAEPKQNGAISSHSQPPTKVKTALADLQVCIRKVRRQIHSNLDQILSQYFFMDLSSLLYSRVGEVIRSFQPIDIDSLYQTLEKFDQEGGKEKFALLLHVGAQINERPCMIYARSFGKSAVEMAVSRLWPEAVRLLIGAGADLNDETGPGSGLMKAVKLGRVDLVQLLMEGGADLEMKEDQRTVLRVALECQEREVAKYLVDVGTDLSAVDQLGPRPLDIAAFLGQTDVVQRMLDKGADVHAVTKNPSKPDHDILDGVTAVHHAACGGHTGTVSLLLDQEGGDVNVRSARGLTPLMCTVIQMSAKGVPADHVEVAQLLLSRGARLDAEDKDGMTLLHIAAQNFSLKVAELAIDSGIDVDARNNHWQTPLLIVCRGVNQIPGTAFEKDFNEQSVNLARLLVDRGANLWVEDLEGNTPWSLVDSAPFAYRPLRTFIAQAIGNAVARMGGWKYGDETFKKGAEEDKEEGS